MQPTNSEDRDPNQQSGTVEQSGPKSQGNEGAEVPGAAAPRTQAPGGAGKKKWIIIGTAGVAALLVAIVGVAGALYFLSDDGPPSADSLPGLVPEDVEYLAVWKVDEILESNILEGFAETDPERWLRNLSPPFGGELQLEPTEIDQYVQTVVANAQVEMVSGRFEFEDIRDELGDQGYEDSTYRGYEVWTGWRTYALLEKEGFIITGETEDATEDILNSLYRGEGSLAESRDGDMVLILGELKKGPVVVATTSEAICLIKRCQGMGIAVTGYNIEDEEATGEFRMLFSSERAAEAAADEYDEISDFFENWINFEIYDAEVDGEFVHGTGTGEEAFLDAID